MRAIIYVGIVIAIIILLSYGTNVGYYISLLTSNCICEESSVPGYKICKGLHVNNKDISGPSNALRLGVVWEPHVVQLIKEHCSRDKLSLDIGAHIGSHTINMAKYSKKVYSFEPNDHVIDNLILNTRNIDNVKVFKNAVGNENKMVAFNATSISSRSSVEKFIPTAYVRQIKLDAIKFNDRVGFIKIDIEGGEINAFKGMSNLINRDHPIIVYEDHTGETTRYLKNAHNYKIKKIHNHDYLAIWND